MAGARRFAPTLVERAPMPRPGGQVSKKAGFSEAGLQEAMFTALENVENAIDLGADRDEIRPR